MSQTADQFLCILDLGTGRDEDCYPLATGATREQAREKGLPRGLNAIGNNALALGHSGFTTVAQPNLTAEEFAELGRTLDTFFAGQVPA